MANIFQKLFKGQIQIAYLPVDNGYHAPMVVNRNIDMIFDEDTGSLRTIDTVHAESHLGKLFEASYLSPDGNPIGDDDDFEVMLVVGPDVEAHLTFSSSAGGAYELRMFRGVTTSDDGTVLPAIIMNGTSANVADSSAFHTPTVTDEGTQMFEEYVEGGTVGLVAGGSTREEIERIFAANTKTLIRLTNRSGQARPMSSHIQWYEE